MTLEVAILLTNNDTSPFSGRFPNDGEKVASELALVRPSWHSRVWSVKDNDIPKSADAEAFIITGSPASVHDPLSWIAELTLLIKAVNRERIPLVGLCFGHQLIATALGGEVQKNPAGWRFGAVETQFYQPLHGMPPQVRSLRLFASHTEQVTQLPSAALLLGRSEHCPVASFSIGHHILTTQYHPEFTAVFMKALALEYQGEVPDEVLRQGQHEIGFPTDGALFFRWMAAFIESSRQQRG